MEELLEEEISRRKKAEHELSKVKTREAIVEILSISLRYWEQSTGKTKIELAEESMIWTVSNEKNGSRTRTLDKYLKLSRLPENIRILIELLGAEYATIPATSGAVALKKSQAEPLPDLIILDIMMPEMDGYDVCRQLKGNELTRNIPVIFITAVSEVMDEAKAFKLGAVDYVTKPFHPVTIAARVKTHLELSRHIKELRQALDTVKTLSGLIPICSGCKKIRDDQGYWKQVESYICEHTDARFSHGICPDCMKTYYPEMKISQKDISRDTKDE